MIVFVIFRRVLSSSPLINWSPYPLFENYQVQLRKEGNNVKKDICW